MRVGIPIRHALVDCQRLEKTPPDTYASLKVTVQNISRMKYVLAIYTQTEADFNELFCICRLVLVYFTSVNLQVNIIKIVLTLPFLNSAKKCRSLFNLEETECPLYSAT